MKVGKKIVQLLEKEYPNPKCQIDFSTALELLVATILSAQCTDVRVNMVTKELFKKYKKPQDYANAKIETFEQEIRSTGFYKNKAKSIINACKKIVNDHNGKVPETMEELIKLPGVARKTANVILFNAFNKNEGIVVDTHVKRVTKRLGFTKHEVPEKVEQDLMQIIPQEEWGLFAERIKLLGQQVCKAPKPKCQECKFNKLCPSAFKIK